ncbi:PP2C family protein-serine/threonine phosphatase [Treponema sp.]
MILAFIDFALVLALIPFGFWLRFRIADSVNARYVFLYFQLVALVALGIGGATASSMLLANGTALFFARLAGSATVASHLITLLLSFTFPYEKQPRIFSRIALLLWLVFSYLIFFTNHYLLGFSYQAGYFIRERGDLYTAFTLGGFSLGLLSVGILLLRRSFFKSMIFRLQTAVVAVGLVLGYLVSFALAIVLPFTFDLSLAYALFPLGGALLAAALGYGVTITRLFNVRTVAKTGLSFALYSLTLGLVSGLGIALLTIPFGNLGFLFSVLIAGLIYLISSRLGLIIRRRFQDLRRDRGTYGDALEEALSAIDFATGRDVTINEFLRILKENLDCSTIDLLVSDATGELVPVGSTRDLPLEVPSGFEHNSAGMNLLSNNDIKILLKTEIITNYEYHEVKDKLLAIFDHFDAEALVLLREGRSLIGAVLLGGKQSGAGFTDYDYETLSRVYGKLFVTLYYLKNIAQESLVLTVDRELEFSDQIIQSIQENIDHLEHPAVDLAYMTQSTRKLGGDFIDFIRVGQDRYIFVIGDVAGKGLNASMSMVILKSVIRTFLRETKDFKQLIIKTNSFIKKYLPRGTFFAGVFGLFDFKERSLFYVNCGVPLMLLLSSSYNNPVEIQGEGKVLGFVKDFEPHLAIRKASFKVDDVLVVTTDGLTDASSARGARFGKERIQNSILENRAAPAERMVQFLVEEVGEFVSQELNDDITILAVKFK